MPQQKSIKDQIGLLIKLQVIDGEIYILNREKQDMPGHIKSIEESLEDKKTGIKQAEQDLKGVQVRLKEKEVSVQQKEENIKKLQGQLYQIKTNKEYAAMLREIEGLKADNSLIEEEMLKLMDEIEIAKKKITEEKELFKKEEDAAKKEKDRVSVRAKELEARLTDLSGQRNEIAPNIDKQVLAKYERVLKNKDGLAIVMVENNACCGCHMNLPSQVVNEAKIKEDIIVCGNCNRILYVEDNVEIN